MPLFRQRQQRFRKKENLLDPNGQLIGLGSKQVPAHANRISQVQQMKQLESLFADNVFLYIDLNALARSLQVCKTRFPHKPEGHDAASDPHLALGRLQFHARGLTVLVYQCSGCIRPAEFPWIRIVPQRLDLCKFLLALFKLVARQNCKSKILSKATASEYSGARVD